MTTGTGRAPRPPAAAAEQRPTVPDDELLLARAYLSRVGEPADLRLWDFVRANGPVEAANALRRGRAPAQVLACTAARRGGADPAADLDAATRHGLRLVVPESDEWPHFALAGLDRAAHARLPLLAAGRYRRGESGEPVPPLALWVRGPAEVPALALRALGVVGARAATAYGEHVTTELAYGLAGRQVQIVSGGAYGIDAAAHRAALAAGGVTVLVSAGGLDRAYPASNSALFEQIADSGLLVAESPPGCAPQRPRFLTRNRLIAAFSTGVVVVEAAARSGAMNTAAHARALGRTVMAVPGPVTSAMSVGCHALLRRDDEPALLVTSVEDVIALVGSCGEGLYPQPAAAATPDGPDLRDELAALDPVERCVFEGLPARRFAGPDEVAARSGVTAVEVVRALPGLESAGLVEVGAAGYRIAERVRRSLARGSRRGGAGS